MTSEGVLTVKVGARAMQTHVADVAPTAESKASRAAAATFGKAGPQKSRAGRQGKPWEATSVACVLAVYKQCKHKQCKMCLRSTAAKQGMWALGHLQCNAAQAGIVTKQQVSWSAYASCIIPWFNMC